MLRNLSEFEGILMKCPNCDTKMKEDGLDSWAVMWWYCPTCKKSMMEETITG